MADIHRGASIHTSKPGMFAYPNGNLPKKISAVSIKQGVKPENYYRRLFHSILVRISYLDRELKVSEHTIKSLSKPENNQTQPLHARNCLKSNEHCAGVWSTCTPAYIPKSSPHLSIPDCLRCVKLSKEDLSKFLCRVVLQVAYHGLRKDVSQYTAYHDIWSLVLHPKVISHMSGMSGHLTSATGKSYFMSMLDC